jgi:DNA-directed RNA polymerase specialized sigma24 family protein
MSASFYRTTNATVYSSPPASAGNAGADEGAGLPVVQHEIRDRLRNLARKLCNDPNQYEDLEQVALICHWQAEISSPGQTVSWYEQRCRFCLQDYLKKGRSVDSLKHGASGCSMDELGGPELAAGGDLVQEVCARDAVEELARHLHPAERETLRLLLAGLTVREIAREQHCSQRVVVARLSRIRSAAISLGIHAAGNPWRARTAAP